MDEDRILAYVLAMCLAASAAIARGEFLQEGASPFFIANAITFGFSLLAFHLAARDLEGCDCDCSRYKTEAEYLRSKKESLEDERGRLKQELSRYTEAVPVTVDRLTRRMVELRPVESSKTSTGGEK
jgi:hypothetical protein